jgi:hypothetical protein
MANAVLLAKTLRLGVDEALYAATGGAINATGAMATFALPPQASNYRGVVVFQSVQVGGTVTTATFQVETAMAPQAVTGSTGAINGQTAFEIFNKLANFSASPATVVAYSALPLIVATVGKPIAVDLSGLGGSGLIRLNFTTVTLGTGSGLDVYAHIG